MQLHTLPLHQLGELLEKKELGSEELTKAFLARIDKFEDELKAFVTVTKDAALTQARTVDEKRSRGEALSPLAGIPMAINDNICTKGVKTSCASKMLDNYIPPYDADVSMRLRNAGAVLLGKCNMDEFGMGASTESSAFYSTKNPFDPAKVPGGANGGAAAAVASGEAAFALGSDTGGDIRQPAAFCGVIGLKPTYGSVPRNGLISHASSLDQIGPFTRDMTDLALILNTICGPGAADPACENAPDFTKSLANDVKGLRIGLPQEYFGSADPQIAERIREAARKLEELGAVCEEVSLPHTAYALPAYYIISSAEASSNLARYDGVRYGLRVDAEDVLSMFKKSRSQGFVFCVKTRIMLGTHALSTANYNEYYVKALQVRSLVQEDFARAFEKFDCLLTPATPATAFKKGQIAGDSPAMYQASALAIPANLTGAPALSLPFGLVDGLPAGLQLIGRHFDEGSILRVGYTLEQNTDQTRPQAALYL